MATQTLHYHLIKPASADRVAVGDMNDNSDIIDGNLFQANERADQLADDYNPSSTYNVGDYVRRENYIYKCNTASTTGTWDSTKWDRIMITDELGGGGGSSTLAGLNDVNISSPSTGQALIYNSTTQKWENGAGGGGSSTFAGLNDVSVAGVADKDIARYNSTTQKWEKSSDLTDLELRVSQISASTLGITNGHTILDSNGTAMAQEDDLQFASGYVEDDSGNGKTVYIEMIRISQANYDTLKANAQLKTGAKYFIYDAQPVAVNASNLPYSSTASTKQAIQNLAEEFRYHKGDTMVFGGGNFMLAGRTGWSGKQFYFGIPLGKPLGVDVTGATISYSGVVYGVSYNQAIDFSSLSKTDAILGIAAGRCSLTWEMVFTTAPMSITDGIVNLMVNTPVTITFT